MQHLKEGESQCTGFWVLFFLSVLVPCKVILCNQCPHAPFCGAVAHSNWLLKSLGIYCFIFYSLIVSWLFLPNSIPFPSLQATCILTVCSVLIRNSLVSLQSPFSLLLPLRIFWQPFFLLPLNFFLTNFLVKFTLGLSHILVITTFWNLSAWWGEPSVGRVSSLKVSFHFFLNVTCLA